MNSSVDTRVVELQFDNSQFEKNVKTSLDSLNELNESLGFENASKGAKELSNAFSSANSGSITSSISNVETSFSALEIAGIRVIQNLTDTVVNFGKNIISKYVVSPITTGFNKYGEKNTAMRTTLNAVKERYETEEEATEAVTNSVEKLMWFSDETSYSFTEMLSNISKFTAAGGDLAKSTDVMIGISNAAALAGQNSSSAARAMYNLAQAYGTGSVKLIDWKSVENANIATSKLKQTIIDAGVELGTLQKKGDKVFAGNQEVTTGTFNNTLATGWFNKDVMEKAFGEYASFTNALFEESQKTGLSATELLNTINEVKEGSANAEGVAIISSMIKNLGIEATDSKSELDILSDSIGAISFKAAQEARTFGDAMDAIMDVISTGWMDVSEKVFGDVNESAKIWTTFANEVSSALWEIPGRLAEILDKWRELEGHTALFNSIGNIWNSFKSIIGAIADAFKEVFGSLEDAGTALANVTKKFEKLTKALMPSQAVLNALKTSIKAVLSVVKLAINLIKVLNNSILPIIGLTAELLSFIKVSIIKFAGNALTSITNFIDNSKNVISNGLADISVFVKKFYSSVTSFFSNFVPFFKAAFSKIKNLMLVFFEKIKNVFEKIKSVVANVPKIISTLWTKSISTAKDIISKFGTFFTKVFSKIKVTISSVSNKISTVWASALVKVKNTISSIPTLFTNAWNKSIIFCKNLFIKFGEFFRGVFDKIRSIIFKASGDLSNGVGTNVNNVKGTLEKLLNRIKPIADKIKNVFINSFTKIKSTFNTIVASEPFQKIKIAASNASSFLSNVWEKSTTFVRNLITNFGDTSSNVFSKIKDVVVGVAEKFKATWGSAIDKIKTTIGNLVSKVKPIADKIKTIFVNVGEKLKSVFQSVFSKIKEIFSGVGAGSSGGSLLGRIKKTLVPIDPQKEIEDWSLLKTGKILLNKVKSIFTDFKGFAAKTIKVLDIGKNIGSKVAEFISSIKGKDKTLGEVATSSVESMGGMFESVSKFMKAKAKGAKSTNFLKIAISLVAICFALIKVVDAIKQLNEMSPENILKGTIAIVGILAALGGLLIAFNAISKKCGDGKINLGFMLGLVVIISSIKKISDSIKDLKDASFESILPSILAIAGILAAISAVFIIVTKFSKVGTGLTTNFSSFSSIANSVVSIAPSFVTLGAMSVADIAKGTLAITAILGAVTATLVIASKQMKGIKGTFAVPAAFAAISNVVVSVAPVFINLSELSVGQIVKGSTAMALILTEIAATLIISSKLITVTDFAGIYAVTSGFKSIGESIALVGPVFISLSELTVGAIAKGAIAMLLILAEMSAAFLILSKFSSFSLGALLIGPPFKAIAEAVSIVSPMFISLGGMSVSEILKGALALNTILLSLSATMGLLNLFMNFFSAAKMIFIVKAFSMLSEALGSMMNTFKIISELDGSSITESVREAIHAIVSICETFYGSFDMFLDRLPSNRKMKSFTGLIGSIGTLIADIVPSFKQLKDLKATEVESASSAMKAMLSSLTDVVEKTTTMGGLFSSSKVVSNSEAYANIAKSVVDIVEPYIKLSKLKPSSIESGNSAITSILRSMGDTLTSMRSNSFIKGSSYADIGEGLANTSTSIANIADPYIKLGKLSASQLDKASKAMEIVLNGMAKALDKLANSSSIFVGSKVANAGEGYKNVAEAVKDIVDPFKKLSSISQSKAESASSVLNAILSAISDSLTTTFNATETGWFSKKESIVDIGTSYKDVAEAVSTITPSFKTLSGISVSQAESGANALNAILKGISSSLTTTFEGTQSGWFKEKESIVDVGSTYKDVASAVETITPSFKTLSGINQSQAASGCSVLNAILHGISSSLTTTFDGTTSGWFKEKESITEIGTAYKDVAESVSTITPSFKVLSGINQSQAASGCSVLNAILTGIGNSLSITFSGTTVGWLQEGQDIAGIGSAYKNVAESVKEIVDPFKKLSEIKPEDADNAGKVLNSILNGISSTLVTTSEGTTNPIFMVSQNIDEIGSAYQLVADAIDKVVGPFERLCAIETNVSQGTQAYKTIVDSMASALGDGSLWDNIFGGEKKRGQAFLDFANALDIVINIFKNDGTFSEASANIDKANIPEFASKLQAMYTPLSDLASLGTEVGGETSPMRNFSNIFNNIVSSANDLRSDGTVKDAGTILKDINDSFNNLIVTSESIKEDDGKLDPIIEAMKKMSGLKKGTLSGLVNNFSTLVDDITSLIDPQLNIASSIDVITASIESLSSSGDDMAVDISNGISTNAYLIVNEVSWAMSKANAKAGDYYTKFNQTGKNLMNGFKSGIYSKKQDIIDAIEDVCKGAKSAAEIVLSIHSPSKVFAQIGRYVDEGFVNGVNDGKMDAVNSVREICKSAVYAAETLSNDYNGDFTITPVLDLSNVEVGTRTLSTMLSRNKAISASVSVNEKTSALNSNSAEGIQNVANSSGSTFTFTQNNYSPKALSRSDIYRTTKNQFSMLKGLINA